MARENYRKLAVESAIKFSKGRNMSVEDFKKLTEFILNFYQNKQNGRQQ